MVVGVVILVVIGLAILFLLVSVKVVTEFERAVVFRLGRVRPMKGPGLIIVLPIIDRIVRVGLRTVTLEIPPQELVTRDNVTVRVNGVAYFKVIDADRAVLNVQNYQYATSQAAQTTLRSILRTSPRRVCSQSANAISDILRPHRRHHRAVGRRGHERRGQGRRAVRADAAGHGAPGRGGARAAGQGHPRPRASSRRRRAAPGRRGAGRQPRPIAAALAVDAHRNRRGEELDDHLPVAGGADPADRRPARPGDRGRRQLPSDGRRDERRGRGRVARPPRRRSRPPPERRPLGTCGAMSIEPQAPSEGRAGAAAGWHAGRSRPKCQGPAAEDYARQWPGGLMVVPASTSSEVPVM